MQSIKVHELAPPTCVLLLSKNFDPSLFLNVAPSLSMSNLYFFYISSLPLYNLSPHSITLSYLCTIFPPLSSISIKGVLLIDAKVCSCRWGMHSLFDDHLKLRITYGTIFCMIDITCRIPIEGCDTIWNNFIVWNHLYLSILTISWTFAIFMSTTYKISHVGWSRHYLWILDEILKSRYHLKHTN